MDRRLYQRIPVQVPAIATTEAGVRIKVVAVEVSNLGLCVECNNKQRDMITPRGCFVHEGRPVSVFVDLNLTTLDGLSSKVVARCQVVFSRRMSRDQCKIGLRYADIENSDHEQLVRFIQNTLNHQPCHS